MAFDAARERFQRFAWGRLLDRTTNTIIRNLHRKRETRSDWVALLRDTPNDELWGWHNFGARSLADVRQFIPYGRPGDGDHPWWLLSGGYQS